MDSYYKISKNLIDEGQFGAPIILTPFNYKRGKQYGVEFTATITSAISRPMPTPRWNSAKGKDIISSQFNFDPGDLPISRTTTSISITSNI